MDEETTLRMIAFLKKNADVFALGTEELTGVDPRIMVHSLNVDPTIRPVRQKKRDHRQVHDCIITEEDDDSSRQDISKKFTTRIGFAMLY